MCICFCNTKYVYNIISDHASRYFPNFVIVGWKYSVCLYKAYSCWWRVFLLEVFTKWLWIDIWFWCYYCLPDCFSCFDKIYVLLCDLYCMGWMLFKENYMIWVPLVFFVYNVLCFCCIDFVHVVFSFAGSDIWLICLSWVILSHMEFIDVTFSHRLLFWWCLED